MKKRVPWFLFLIIIFSLGWLVLLKREVYLKPYDTNFWQARYEESNWLKGWEAKTPLGDADLYAYAGWRQIQGDDPTKINAETPPLGKYLLGLSILLLGNPYWISLFSGLALLLITFLISRKVLIDPAWSMVPVLFLSFDGIFRGDLSTSMLDLPFSVFITLSFYFLLRARENPRFYPLLLASLGAVAATKLYLVGFGLTMVIFFYLLLLSFVFRCKDIIWFLISAPIFLLIYVGSYLVYFLNNHNLWDFKYLHFWIRHFARVQVENYPKFEILRILLLGQWKTWWDGSGIIKIPQWNPLWLAGTLSFLGALYWSLKEKNQKIVILLIWIFSLLLMFSSGVPYPRYLLPVLPAIYILLALAIKKLAEIRLWKNEKL